MAVTRRERYGHGPSRCRYPKTSAEDSVAWHSTFLAQWAASMSGIHRLVLICVMCGCIAPATAVDRSSVKLMSAAALSSDIARQPLADALSEFARQTGLQLVYVSEV